MTLKTQNGITLIELLIGMAVGLVVLAGMIFFLVNLSQYSVSTIRQVRLNYELQAAMSLLTKDIRRAGYHFNAKNMIGLGVNSNPFMSATTDISVPSTSCVLFSYDLDNDGALPSLNTPPNDERFGYRLNNQIIQTRSQIDTNFSCNSGSWDDLTNIKIIEVTNLTFSLINTVIPLKSPPTTESVVIRNLAISITARLASDNSVTQTLSTNLRIRNDKYQP